MKDYSNYHNTDYSEKFFKDSNERFERSLKISPEAETVQVNGIDKRVILSFTSDANKRSILFKENDIQHGDYVVHKGHKWLVTDMPLNNKIYDKSKMALCNESIEIVVDEGEREIIGWDDMNRPIYSDPVPVTKDLPIVVESKTDSAFDRDEQINLPEGRLVGQIQYDSTLPISLETKFNVFKANYVVYNIDLSKVYDNKGVMRLFIEKTV